MPWFTGGVSVIDFSNPATPEEVAFYRADPSATYAVAWHRGRLYASDMYQGLLVLEVKGLYARPISRSMARPHHRGGHGWIDLFTRYS